MRLGGGYWRFWTSSGFSNLADGVFHVALPLLALSLTRDPVLVAGVSVAMSLPWLFFTLVAGAAADRLDRRLVLASVSFARTAVIGLLAVAVATDVVQLWMVYVAALLLGVGETLFDTSAQSVLPAVVPPDLLGRANGRLYGVEIVANSFVGPPLGGLLAGVGLALALTGSAAGFGLAALALLTLRGSFRPERQGPATSVAADIREGLSYLLGHALLRRLALLVGGSGLGFSAVGAVLVLYVVAPGPLGLTEAQYGLFLTGTGVGAVLGSLLAERVESRLGRSLALKASVVAFAVMLASPLIGQPVAVAAVSALGSFAVVVWNVITVSLRQRIVPDHLLGRVNAGYRLLAWGSQPVGALAGGVLAQLVGLRAVFVVAGLGMLLLLLGTRGLTDEVLADPDASTVDR